MSLFGLRRRPGSHRRRQRGQGLVEFALIAPLFFLLLLSMLDFGFAFYTNLTIEYASREGARVGAALAAGNSSLPCAQVDNYVMAAVQRVLQSAGIRVDVDPVAGGGVNWVRIFKADVNGAGYGTGASPPSTANQWTYQVGGGPTVDGRALDFKKGTENWSACTPRLNGATPDSIGVAISYDYAYITPLAGAFRLISPSGGVPTIKLLDKTVMQLNPTNP